MSSSSSSSPDAAAADRSPPDASSPADAASSPSSATPQASSEPEPIREASGTTAEGAADFSYTAELKRKALHLLALVVPLGIGWLGKPDALYLLVPSAGLALAADTLRAFSSGFNAVIRRIFGPLMRAEELPGVGGGVRINGATWVLVAATLLTLLFPVAIVVPAFVMAMIADAAAALVGRRFGRTPWGRSGRTVEGSAAFLLIGAVILLLFPSVSLPARAGGLVAATLAEIAPAPLNRVNDNVLVPLVAATAMTFIG